MVEKKEIKEFLENKGIHVPASWITLRVLNLVKNEYYTIAVVPGEVSHQLYLLNDQEELKILQDSTVNKLPTYNKPKALLSLEEESGETGEAVWKPGRLSYSPFYPFWRISRGQQIIYIDSNNTIYREEDINDSMHG